MEVMLFRYQERMNISYTQAAIETPWAEIERAFFVWCLDAERAEIDDKRNTPL
jgi:hypothetical protein